MCLLAYRIKQFEDFNGIIKQALEQYQLFSLKNFIQNKEINKILIPSHYTIIDWYEETYIELTINDPHLNIASLSFVFLRSTIWHALIYLWLDNYTLLMISYRFIVCWDEHYTFYYYVFPVIMVMIQFLFL